MSEQQEALRLALEALEWFTAAEQGDEPPINKAITAIRDALAHASKDREWPAQQCNHCNGSGRMVRDPDIGTDQECFVCEGVGFIKTEQPAQQEPVAWRWTESNGQHWFDWRTDWTHHDRAKAMGFAIEYAYASQSASKPLTDEQINLFINGRGEEGDDDYVEPTGDGFGLTDADLVRLVRRVEAAHGITGEQK